MKNYPEITDDLLLGYLLHTLGPSDMKNVEAIVQINEEVALRLKNLQAEEMLLKEYLPGKAPAFLADKVMESVQIGFVPKIPIYLRLQSILLLTGILVAVGIFSWVVNEELLEPSLLTQWLPAQWEIGEYQLHTPALPNWLEGANAMNYLAYFTLFVTLLLFDRAVLRPFFNKRNHMSHVN
jgi:hypothetical protein